MSYFYSPDKFFVCECEGWGVSWVCLGRVKGINWTCYSLLSLSQEWTKMRNYRHKSDSISAQIYFTRYIGEQINQFIINFYVQIFQCILHNLYPHKKLKFNIQRSLLINICWGRVSQTRFMTFLITDNWVANDNDSTNHRKLQARCDDLWFLIVGQMIACIIF